MSECINQAYAMGGRHAVPVKTAIARNPAGFGATVRRGAGMLAKWQERVNSRHALLKLDDRMLRDIGVSRADAVSESDKPFWRG
ncbi:MAG: DUF1127 domain-containing protein [Alphaproteobacteria bacterium]